MYSIVPHGAQICKHFPSRLGRFEGNLLLERKPSARQISFKYCIDRMSAISKVLCSSCPPYTLNTAIFCTVNNSCLSFLKRYNALVVYTRGDCSGFIGDVPLLIGWLLLTGKAFLTMLKSNHKFSGYPLLLQNKMLFMCVYKL